MKLKNAVIISLMIASFFIVINTNVFAKTVIVDTDTLRLRKEASTDAETIILLDKGNKLEYIDEEGNWYKVKTKGITGYVSKDFTKLEEDTKKEETTTEKETANEEIPNEETTSPAETTENQNETIIEETSPAQPTEMKVVKDSKIYILPLINANIIDNIQKDNNVKILSMTNKWAYVETDSVMGWIRLDALTDSSVVSDDKETDNTEQKTTENKIEDKKEEKTQTSEDKEITPKIMYVSTSSIYVRKGPGTDYEVVDSLIINNTVKVVAENGDWYKVEVDGKTGYIAKRLLSNSSTSTTTRSSDIRAETQSNQENTEVTNTTAVSSSKGQQIVDFAKKYLGCKYVYGGSGPSTFDCSGFTMYVLKNFGVTLSHSATAQSKVGTYVSKDNLQPGDLVFFTDYETGSGIGHVGIYIGGGDFIHASSGTGYCVKISTLLSGSYYNRYETARRVI